MATKSGGIDRVLAKCRACVEKGDFYEAHQMYRTLYFRYKGQKKYTEALNLLYNGSLTLLQHNQHSSGADLAMLMIELLNTALTPVTEDTIDRVVRLFRVMPAECPERHMYMVSAIRWSTKVDNQHKLGHPDLHQRIGLLFWEEKNYAQARYHLLHSSDGKSCATMLIEYHLLRGYASEVDLFIAQAVLQYLCLQNKETANVAFLTYTKNHPQVKKEGSPYVLPLLNFIWFLLLALEGGRLTVFTILCEKYETSINRDPTYKEYLDKIGQVFFGVPPPRAAPQGMLGNLLTSLFSGGDDDDDAMQMSTSSWGSMASSMTTSTKDINQVELD